MGKSFDCVEMKREGARLVQARLAAMTREEQIEYWARRSREFEERVLRARLRRDGVVEQPGEG